MLAGLVQRARLRVRGHAEVGLDRVHDRRRVVAPARCAQVDLGDPAHAVALEERADHRLGHARQPPGQELAGEVGRRRLGHPAPRGRVAADRQRHVGQREVHLGGDVAGQGPHDVERERVGVGQLGLERELAQLLQRQHRGAHDRREGGQQGRERAASEVVDHVDAGVQAFLGRGPPGRPGHRLLDVADQPVRRTVEGLPRAGGVRRGRPDARPDPRQQREEARGHAGVRRGAGGAQAGLGAEVAQDGRRARLDHRQELQDQLARRPDTQEVVEAQPQPFSGGLDEAVGPPVDAAADEPGRAGERDADRLLAQRGQRAEDALEGAEAEPHLGLGVRARVGRRQREQRRDRAGLHDEQLAAGARPLDVHRLAVELADAAAEGGQVAQLPDRHGRRGPGQLLGPHVAGGGVEGERVGRDAPGDQVLAEARRGVDDHLVAASGARVDGEQHP